MVWVHKYRNSPEIFTSDKLISRTKIQQIQTIRSQKRRVSFLSVADRKLKLNLQKEFFPEDKYDIHTQNLNPHFITT